MLAARDVIFVRELLIDLAITVNAPSVIYSDSKSAVGMAFDPVAFKKTKHILRAAEFLRDLVAREVVVLQHVSGTVMVADLLTKAVARAMFVELMRILSGTRVLVSHVPPRCSLYRARKEGGAVCYGP